MPTASVVTATYNRADILPRAVESVLDQTHGDVEHVVVDDGSTDDTPEVMARYDDDPRVRYLRWAENRGANAARNEGIREARGRVVSFLDSDDEFAPDHLRRATETLDALPETVLGVYTSYAVVSDGEVVDTFEADPGAVSYEDILLENRIGSFSATTFRRSAFERVGYLDETLAARQDLDFYVRLLAEYEMHGIEEVLLWKHQREDSISADLDRKLRGHEQFLAKHGAKLPPEAIANIHYQRAFEHEKHDDMGGARREFGAAIRHDPSNPWYYYFYVAAALGATPFEAAFFLKHRLG
jgi:glycosyltransferase involved in cell wall biosynthesis